MSVDDKQDIVVDDEIEVMPVKRRYKKYRDSQSSAEDNKSSGWVLLFIGIVGLVAVVLGMFGVIPFKFRNSYLIYGVLIAIFILFLVMGVISFVNARKFEAKAKGEKNLEDEIIKWAQKHISPEEIDSEIEYSEREAEEILFFKRTKIIYDKLNNQFMNLDPQFIETLVDNKLYDSLFPESLEVDYEEINDSDDEESDDE